ncbi:protein S40-4-like [Lycium barbarum]|uniref:protein S40-4-like n=1 Tax=Lycium barbarum TaxID=112863 RepID=UPI00293F6262|nr:protein S40-4-like [Lycium barbarum]
MASRNGRISLISPNDLQFEFDEADIWNNNNSNIVPSHSESKKLIPSSRFLKKPAKIFVPAASTSLPVKVPDWSEILGNEYENCLKETNYNVRDNDDFDEDNRIPPHEYLARTRMASFSVQEGMGRTLKGRDLSRVRNAIWKQTGFED